MKFMLYRTSGSFSDKPHPKAELMEFEGRKNPQWAIEINTLEELIEFLEDESTGGRIIIEESFRSECPDNRMIEIYDTYRE